MVRYTRSTRKAIVKYKIAVIKVMFNLSLVLNMHLANHAILYSKTKVSHL